MHFFIVASLRSDGFAPSHMRFLVPLLIIIVSLLSGYTAAAQSQSWSPPDVIFETNGWTFNVAVIADSTDQLIALWQYNPYKKTGEEQQLSLNENDSLFLAWYRDGVWSEPVEVLLGSVASGRLAVIVDQSNQLHVFSHNQCLWHVVVDLAQIERVRSWSTPECLAGASPSWPAASLSADGRINLVYSDTDASGLYLIFSDDQGFSWSLPQIVFSYIDRRYGVAAPALAETPDGVMHLVWGEVPLPDGYPYRTIMYSRSLDRGISWSEPLSLAGSRQGEPVIVTDHLNRVHIAWNGDASNGGRYYVQSPDSGHSWLPVEKVLSGEGGLQYPPAIAVDSTGNVHLLVTDQANLYYGKRESNGWEPLEQLIGPTRMPNQRRLSEIDSVRLLLTRGNNLHAMYTRFAHGEVFHQLRIIDAPDVTPPTVISLSAVDETITVGIEPTPAMILTPATQEENSTQDFDLSGSSQPLGIPLLTPILLAFLSSCVVLALFFVFHKNRR